MDSVARQQGEPQTINFFFYYLPSLFRQDVLPDWEGRRESERPVKKTELF